MSSRYKCLWETQLQCSDFQWGGILVRGLSTDPPTLGHSEKKKKKPSRAPRWYGKEIHLLILWFLQNEHGNARALSRARGISKQHCLSLPRISPCLCLLQLQLPHQGSLRHNAPHELPPDHIHSRPRYLAKVALVTSFPRECTQVTPLELKMAKPPGTSSPHRACSHGRPLLQGQEK